MSPHILEVKILSWVVETSTPKYYFKVSCYVNGCYFNVFNCLVMKTMSWIIMMVDGGVHEIFTVISWSRHQFRRLEALWSNLFWCPSGRFGVVLRVRPDDVIVGCSQSKYNVTSNYLVMWSDNIMTDGQCTFGRIKFTIIRSYRGFEKFSRS